MTRRRGAFIVGLVVVSLSTGVAFGYVKGGMAKPLKCKANACAHWDFNGNLLGDHPGVISVSHTGTGTYCIEIVPKLLVTTNMVVQLTPNYDDGAPGNVNIIEWYSAGTPCGENGIAVLILNVNDDAANVDGAGTLIIP